MADDKKYLGTAGGSSYPVCNQEHRFDCPICHTQVYERVKVPGKDGQLRETSLFRCSVCTVTFTDADCFSADRASRPLNLGKK